MDDTSNPLVAKKLRDAFKAVGDREVQQTDALRGDFAEVRFIAGEFVPGGAPGTIVPHLAICKDGIILAICPLANAALKRFKRDIERVRMIANTGKKDRNFR